MTQELIELLQPCPVPWCLGEADADWYAVGEQDRPYWVRCKACGCKTPRQYATVAEAITAWNTRDQSQSARIAGLRELLASAKALIRVKYGNLDADVNEFVDRIDDSLTKDSTSVTG